MQVAGRILPSKEKERDAGIYAVFLEYLCVEPVYFILKLL